MADEIREQIKNGVDHIKLNLSGGIMGAAWNLHTHSFLLDDEIRAAFEICRKRGFKVMAHATNPDAVKNAIRLGAHSIEHGYIMDDECTALLLEHDTWYVPTLAISHLRPARPPIGSKPLGLPTAGSRMRYVAVPRQPRRCTRRGSARRSIPVYEWHWAPTSALSRTPLCSRWGFGLSRRRDALADAGSGHATWRCGVWRRAELGTVEAGKLADLIVVAANPLEDITNVRRLQLVLKAARVCDRQPRMAMPATAGQG